MPVIFQRTINFSSKKISSFKNLWLLPIRKRISKISISNKSILIDIILSELWFNSSLWKSIFSDSMSFSKFEVVIHLFTMAAEHAAHFCHSDRSTGSPRNHIWRFLSEDSICHFPPAHPYLVRPRKLSPTLYSRLFPAFYSWRNSPRSDWLIAWFSFNMEFLYHQAIQ